MGRKILYESNSDKVVLASSGEEVLFTESEIESELDIKIPESFPFVDRNRY